MKKSEIALIIVVSLVVVIASFTVGNLILGDPSEKVEKIQNVLMPIDSNIATPNSEFFNPYAINPTVEIYVGSCDPGKVWDAALLACVTGVDSPDTEECEEGEVWDADVGACVEGKEDEDPDNKKDKDPENE